ncbi:hypothetical protein Pint_16027 [Pistacia integerrima]|uniref:Uncharacterized protein n=1 Tax=Pistacia integerrima TaxID=434235 RepID=A0ACC0ZBF3_9ROSI|nr:hypothetical protein Pint_16027 [Pistacia integerrima]
MRIGPNGLTGIDPCLDSGKLWDEYDGIDNRPMSSLMDLVDMSTNVVGSVVVNGSAVTKQLSMVLSVSSSGSGKTQMLRDFSLEIYDKLKCS